MVPLEMTGQPPQSSDHVIDVRMAVLSGGPGCGGGLAVRGVDLQSVVKSPARLSTSTVALRERECPEPERALAVLQENANDPPSTVLTERCKAFLQAPPLAGWRGIYISAPK